MKIKILDGEKWFGSEVVHALDYPYGADSEATVDTEHCSCGNQTAPLMLSSAGRYLWCDKGFTAVFSGGEITADSANGEIDFSDERGTLRTAYAAACAKHFPSNGVLPPEEFFTRPQFNTWIELIYDQNQKDILAYARKAVEEGFEPGILHMEQLLRQVGFRQGKVSRPESHD